jgi:hypothetical protein
MAGDPEGAPSPSPGGAPPPGSTPLPPLDGLQRLLLPVADAFMVLMWSRPPSGSLRDTRVTLASLLLAAATLVILAPAGIAALVLPGAGWVRVAGAIVAEVLALGSAALLVYGLRQRR